MRLVRGASEKLRRTSITAREGARVFVKAETRTPWTARRFRIESHGKRPVTVKADIRREEGRERLIAACRNAGILINNNRRSCAGKAERLDRAACFRAGRQHVGRRFSDPGRSAGHPQASLWPHRQLTSAMVKSPARYGPVDRGANPGLTRCASRSPTKPRGQRDH